MKKKFALRNLYISQAVIFIFLLYAYCFWFPYSFTNLGGFFDTAWMLIFVDLVLGPLLVYFIYNENKKYLSFDINVLLSIQLIAFMFGAYSLFLKHPAYAVFTGDRFVLTNVSNIYPKSSWSTQLRKYVFSKPKFVISNLPINIKEKNNLMFEVLLKGAPDIDRRPKYFSPLNESINSVLNKSIKIENLSLNKKQHDGLMSFFRKTQKSQNDFVYFPLKGNNDKSVLWILEKETLAPVKIVEIDPWKNRVAVK